MRKAISVGKAAEARREEMQGQAVLDHQARHLRRCRLTLVDGGALLVDLPDTTALGAGDVLHLEDGGYIGIIAAEEPLYVVTARDQTHLLELAWHLGNRHLPAEIRDGQILILRDHVIRSMLLGLGAQVDEVVAPFHPVRGAYSGHGAGAHPHDAPAGPEHGRHYRLSLAKASPGS